MAETTFTAVTWTTGDVITEAKLDNMTANDQAVDAHAQGVRFAERSDPANADVSADQLFIYAKALGTTPNFYSKEGDGDTVKILAMLNRNLLTDGATVAVDWGLAWHHYVTFAGNRTFTFSNPVAGGRYVLEIIQDGTGSRTATWPGTVNWEGGTAPTLTTTASKRDFIGFVSDGTNYYGVGSSLNH